MEMATTTTTTSEGHSESNEQQPADRSSSRHNSNSGGERQQQHPLATSCSSEESSTSSHITSDNHVHVIPAPIDTRNSSSNMEALSLRKHANSVDNMMDISFVNLREEDADILELGVEEKRMQDLADFDEDGRRLEATSHHRLSSASLTDLVEGLSLDGSFDHVLTSNNNSDASSNNNASCDIAGRPGVSPIRRSIHEESMPAIAEDSSITIPHSSSLEGMFRDGVLPQDDAENDDDDDDYFVGETSPESQSKDKVTADDVDVEALALRISSGRAHHRSVSFDRRMIESAQFAEAVGEDPSLLLQKIIEEDSSSDFDDDDIDEGGDMIGEVGEILEELEDYKTSIETVGSDLRDEDAGSPDVAAASSSSEENNNIEPKCVSTDLSRVSPKDQEEVCNRFLIERKQSFDRRDTDDSQLSLTGLTQKAKLEALNFQTCLKLRNGALRVGITPNYIAKLGWKYQINIIGMERICECIINTGKV